MINHEQKNPPKHSRAIPSGRLCCIAILGGYKKVRQEGDLSIQQESIDLASGSSRTNVARAFTDVDIEGPTIGIATSVPIGHGFGVYASYAHGFMDTEIRDVLRSVNGRDVAGFDFRSPDLDTIYDVAELGFTYTHGMEALAPHMPLSAATVYAGYRYQNISTEFDEPFQDASDVTKGFAVGINLEPIPIGSRGGSVTGCRCPNGIGSWFFRGIEEVTAKKW